MSEEIKNEKDLTEEVKDETAGTAAEEKAEDTEKAEKKDNTEKNNTEATAEEGKAKKEGSAKNGAEGQGAKPEGPAKKPKKEKGSKNDKEKEALRAQVTSLEDRVMRQLAEFENFRNRTEKEKSASYDNGAANVLKKFLPILDNFERGFATVPADKLEDPFVQGMDKVYRQFVTELENIGVEHIEALGKPLDPNLHNAVAQQDSEDFEPGTICAEFQKGYTYHGIVLRYSMVAVVPD